MTGASAADAAAPYPQGLTPATRVGADAGMTPALLADGWVQRAAVLSWFSPALVGAPEQGDALLDSEAWALLMRASEIVHSDGDDRRRLTLSVRRQVLRTLGSRAAMRACLEEVPVSQRPHDGVQRAITRLLGEEQIDLTGQRSLDLDELYGLETIQPWFEDLLPDVPATDIVLAARRRRELLAPHESLAGRAFHGRQKERERLRGYINAVSPQRAREWLMRKVDHLARWWADNPPLVVHGPGGVGKSALIANFVLEHAGLDNFVFVDLDFGRPCIDSRNPETLLAEAVRQIGTQLPHVFAEAERVARDIERTIKPADEVTLFESVVVTEQEHATRPFIRFVRDVLPPQNLPFVLDTFEEAMALGDTHTDAVLRMVAEIQAELPQLRPIICSRVRPQQTSSWHDLMLAEMEPTASIEYLTNQLAARALIDVPHALVGRLTERINRTPLALNIAVELLVQARDQGRPLEQEVAAISVHANEAFLFDRLLKQIEPGDARRLAFPGLIVRRLEPRLVLEVLKGPCNLSITSLAEARSLLWQLAAKVSLIERQGEDVFVHRPDVRRLMLRGLVEAVSAAKVAEVDRAAAEYFIRSDTAQSRAEAAYHLLRLDEIDAAEALMRKPGVADHLRSALEEVSPAARVALGLRLGVTPSQADRLAASEYMWRRGALATAEELLQRGDYEQALSVTREREHVLFPELDRIQAEALVGLGRWDEAQAAAEQGLDRALEAGNANLAITIGLTLARIGFGQDRLDVAEAALARVGGIESEAVPLDLRLLLAVADLRVARVAGDTGRTARAARQTVELLDRDRLGQLMQSTLLEVTGELGYLWPIDQSLALAVLNTGLLSLGFEHALGPDTLRLAQLLRQASQGEDGWAPAAAPLFSANVETSPPALDAADEHWADWLSTVSFVGLGKLLAGLMSVTKPPLRDDLARVIIAQMRATARSARERKLAPA